MRRISLIPPWRQLNRAPRPCMRTSMNLWFCVDPWCVNCVLSCQSYMVCLPVLDFHIRHCRRCSLCIFWVSEVELKKSGSCGGVAAGVTPLSRESSLHRSRPFLESPQFVARYTCCLVRSLAKIMAKIHQIQEQKVVPSRQRFRSRSQSGAEKLLAAAR